MSLLAYTDGGCRGNPGPGAWAFLLIDRETGAALERADGEAATTNNRMELMGAIATLRALKQPNSVVEIRSDSSYVVQAASEWIPGWKARGWRRKEGPLKNLELLQELDRLGALHRVTWRRVKGHAGERLNEHVDRLVNAAMDRLARGESAHQERRGSWPVAEIPA